MTGRRYLIDGYNLLHQLPELRRQLEYSLEDSRQGLLIRLSAFASMKSTDVCVVFDGSGEFHSHDVKWRGVRIIFSKPPQKADPLIKKMISDRKKGEELIVVTSDREIENYARLCGVKVESSVNFAQTILSPPGDDAEKKFDHVLSDREVEEWMRLFRRGSSTESG
jgi:predicted RNA-binding protein with PIN domain